MTSSYVPTTVSQGFGQETSINTNNTDTKTALDEVLNRNNSTSNAMAVDLDLNSNDLLNGGLGQFDTLTVGGVEVAGGGSLTLPDQSGESGNFLTTDGATAAWDPVPEELPAQSGQSGKLLTTDGSVPSWATSASSLPSQSGNASKFLTTNGTVAAWAFTPTGFSTVVAMVADTTIVAGDLVHTKGYFTAGDEGAATYFVKTSAAFGATPDEQGDHTLASGDVAVLQRDGDINVFQFGAKGDGVADNTTVFNAAITAANTGDTITFPAPEVEGSFFLCTGQINVGKRMKLVGGMTKIKGTGVKLFDLTVPQTIMEEFNLLGDRGAGNVAITLNQNYQKIINCQIEEFDQGINVVGGVWHHLTGIRMRNMATTVMTVGNVIGTVCDDVRYDTNTGSFAEPTTGILLNGEGCVFTDLDFIHAGNAMHIKDTATRDVNWNFFNSCSFDTSTRGLLIENLNAGHVVKGLMFDHCWFASHSEEGVKLTGQAGDALDGVTFHDCYFINNTKNGLTVNADAQNIDVNGCTFSNNSNGTSTFDHIEHNSGGRLIISNSFFGNWGNFNTSVAFKIQRNTAAGEIIIDGCTALGDAGSGDFDDNSANPVFLGTNFGDLPSAVLSGAIPDDTTQSSANINITSSSGTFNTVEVASTGLSAIQGTTSVAGSFGIVAKNTAGGVGLRVDQGRSEFVGNGSFDNNLAVSGTSTLAGAVSGTGFNSSVDNRVTFGALNANGDIGTGSTQVSQGNHTHTKSQITDFQEYRMFGTAVTTSSGRATFTHGLGSTPATIICSVLGNGAWNIQPISADSTNMTVEVRDNTAAGALVSTSMTVYTIVSEAL